MHIALALTEDRPISTYPSFVNTILLLQEQGHKVDIYLSAQIEMDVAFPSVEVIRIGPRLFESFWAFFREFRKRRYSYVFFYTGDELASGGLACWLLHIPFVYFCLEVVQYDHNQHVDPSQKRRKALEIFMNKRSVLTVVQDDARKVMVQKAHGLDPLKIMIVPNAYLGINDQRSDYLRDKFSLAKGKVIVLYPGALETWALDARLLAESALWDDKFVLVLHGFSRDGYRDVLREQAREINARMPGRIHFSEEVLSEKEYLKLVASADIGLVWYKRELPENVRTIGKSSGKFSAFMASGIPVVVPSYLELLPAIVRKYCCGISVDGEEDICSALKELSKGIVDYKKNSLECFNEELDFRKFFTKVLSELPAR